MPPIPEPHRERWPALLAGAAFAVGLALLVFALARSGGDGAPQRAAGPAPVPAQPALTVVSGPKPAVAEPATRAPAPRPRRATWREWTRLYRPLYLKGDRAFGVSWLLVAAVHKQETGYSTAAGTYHGLNFAGCCAGPMQFNVTNGRVSTWDRYRHAFRAARRPRSYPHEVRRHPSVYDDFDAMMAASRLLADSGATRALDGGAWQAAYDYYGHDEFGVAYADVVLARAQHWARRGFCALCEPSPGAVAAIHAAYGAPALSALARDRRRAERAARQRRRGARGAS